jgi:2-polyprenyl-3-methyl-5-hydroxy-6-metoxy-1,4-benzoquinol methylase
MTVAGSRKTIMSNEVFDSEQAAAYYDNAAISRFYEECWGGADIHIGRYVTGRETVAEASTAVTQYLVDRAGFTAGQRVLDIACGFGGTLRTLARMGCTAKGIDISQNCVDHARAAANEAGVGDHIDVAVGDFHNIDSEPELWDAVICQEAIIHSPDRPRVFAEVFRVLKPGGTFALSDILTGENADAAAVAAAFARIGASVGATVGDYEAMARAAGFEISFVEERSGDITAHYDKLAEQLARPIAGLDADALASISQSIARWQAALAGGHITAGQQPAPSACCCAVLPVAPRRRKIPRANPDHPLPFFDDAVRVGQGSSAFNCGSYRQQWILKSW